MKTFKISNIEIANRFVLAPLAGFTDFAMRKLSYDKGARLLYTEMESCEALYYGSKATIKDLQDTNLDKQYCPKAKVALQIFGGKQDIILKSIPIIEKNASYDFLDFNCGCPVPKVIKQHSGSFWLNRQDELVELMKDLVSISCKPVIVKIRIGFNEVTNIIELCQRLENVGVQAIAVHGRTRKEMFNSIVHYDVIKDIKEHLSIPVIANGEISEKNFKEVEEATKADGFMIGQNAIGNPSIFSQLIEVEENKPVIYPTLEDQIRDLKEHLNIIFSIKEEHTAASIMKVISVRYLKGFTDIKKYRNLIVKSTNKQEYLDILNQIENNA